MNKYPVQIGVGCADLSDLEKKYVNQVLDSGRLSYGPFSEKFENEFAKKHDRKFAVFSNSGTSALHIALAALKEKYKWSDDDEIIVPALTFVATVNIVIQNRLKPVFVDIDPLTYNIDSSKIEGAITSKTRAIIPVHLFGLPADMDSIMKISGKHNLKVLEDSCETMLVSSHSQRVGSRGDISCFSTYMAHLIVTGVGGLSCTNDNELALIMKSLINHGRDTVYLKIDDDKDTSDSEKFLNIIKNRFSFVRMGFSYRMTEMEAALGVAQLERGEEILSKRKNNAFLLTEGLKSLGEYMQLPSIPEGFEHAYMMYPIVLKKSLDRNKLVLYLEERNIETRYMVPLLNQPYFIDIFGDLSEEFPNASYVNAHGFYIGCHQGLNREMIDFVIDSFKSYFNANV